MKIVNLYDEVTTESVQLRITNKDFKTLKRLECLGGFRRYGLTLYDEVKNAKRQRTELLNFLSGIFVNKSLIESYFKK
jgi:hypothetical protein